MSSRPVMEYVRYRLSGARQVGFEDAYAAAGAVLARSPQCVDYDLARSVDEPSRYILRITWTSAEDHLTGFRGASSSRRPWPRSSPMSMTSRDMSHYEKTAEGGLGASLPSLYEWADGGAALEQLTQTFYGKVRQDPLIGPLFAHMDLPPALRRDVAR